MKNHKDGLIAYLIFSFVLLIVSTDVFGDEYLISFENQRPAIDFGMKELRKVVFIDGKPRIVVDMNAENMAFLDDFGKIEKKRTLTPKGKFLLSKNANFIGVRSLREEWSYDFSLENSQGEVIWQNLFGSDLILISDKGEAVIVVGYKSHFEKMGLDFYDDTGQLAIHLDTDIIKNIEISPLGDKLYLSTASDLAAYDMQANKLWERTTEGGKIFVSDNGELIFNVQVSGEREIYSIEIYDNQGILLGKLEFPNRCELLAISSDSKFIAVRENKKLYLFEAQTQDLIWTYGPELDLISGFSAMGVGAADVAENAELTAVILTGVKKVGPQPNDYEFSHYLRILDIERRKIFERFIENVNFQLQVKVSLKGGFIVVWTPNNIYNFKIERK